ncbi:MAG: chromosome segregation protein SMC [Thermoplasmata archaeon]
MYLKRLKVRNFKSFAGSTEIPFQPGFTGVAGPNGMGKSNISDAILFVLGPTSSKALRADRLTHLLFNGGAAKKSATECEVSLVFDNHDRALPIESDEVEVGRYVKLAPTDPDGYYSYFYLNGRRTTQTEIDSVLSHARLSGDGYNLVQQGDVNRIVSMGPIPRRGLVERLAGISQYDDELQKAEARRTDLETNLGRITTLLGEIRSHLGSLESQREQAIQYKNVQDQKRRAEAQLARAGHLIAQQEVTSCEQQLKVLNTEIERLRTEVARLEGVRDETTRGIDEVERQIAERGGPDAAKFKTELDERRMAFARLDENVQRSEEELERLGERLQSLDPQIQLASKELAQLTGQEQTLSRRLAGAEARSEAAAQKIREATGDAEKSQGKLVGARKEILETDQRLESLQTDWQKAVTSLESAKAALASAERDQAQAEEDQTTREVELRDLELRIKQTQPAKEGRGSSADLQKELFQLRRKEKDLSDMAESLAQEVLELNRRYMALDARLKARADTGHGGALAATDFLLSQRNLGHISGIRGTVEELARFDSSQQTALQVAAGGRFQALVVETDQVAEECIKLLRAEKRGRATFLPLNKMLSGRPHGKSLVAAQSDGAVGFALDLVQFEEPLRPAFWYVFGETVVMRDLPAARSQMGGVRLVTLQGDLIEATGAISGGYIDPGARGKGSDSAGELKRVGEELRAKSQAETAARAELQKIEARVRELSEELARRGGQAEAHDSTVQVLQKEMEAARDRLKEARRRIEAMVTSHSKAVTALERAKEKSEALAKELVEAKDQRTELQESYLGHLPGAVSSRLRSLQEENTKATEEQIALTRELEQLRGSVQAATTQLEQYRSDRASVDKAREEKDKAAKTLAKGRNEAKESLEALKQVDAQHESRVQELSEKKRKMDEERLKIVGKLGETNEALRSRSGMIVQEEARLAAARGHLDEVAAALKEFPNPEPDEKPVPADELKRRIATFQAQLDSLGDVNLRALDEFDEEKTRLDDFQGEMNRLGSEKNELLTLVEEIEKKKREKIAEVVLSVNEGFKEIYSDLSGGGEGEIALENPNDPLAGGLLIKARPVGKNVQRLEQLSGGEKSLASLAFVFALQRHDPSPLYVFDEVDMSLDGVNAENVGRMLRRNAERAQFIVISLRKVTLKFAQQLFGVSMHGDGCSRVVGLNLDEVVDVAERDHERIGPAPQRPMEAV